MTKMTVHRALAEHKLIDAKIKKQMDEITPSSYKQGEKGLVAGIWDEQAFRQAAQSKYDSINDLFKRKVLIKSAIVRSNAVTTVVIAGKTMTVADAIAGKALMALKREFVSSLTSKHRNTIAGVNKNQEVVKSNLQKLLEANLGKDNIKTDSTDVEAISKPYMLRHEVFLIDPLNLATEIDRLNKEISEFEVEVDAVLSESNAVTVVDIED